MPSLEALLASDIELAGVVTNPDRPSGRGMALAAPAVKKRALKAGLEVYQPAGARGSELRSWLAGTDCDFGTVVAYGSILPQALLDVPRRGFVNLHFSLLPLYRGAAPVQRALMDGRSATGVSIMVLTEGMDEGPVLAAREIPVAPSDSAGSLGERLALSGAGLMVEVLEAYGRGALEARAQDDSKASYAPKISSEEAAMDWTRPSGAIRDLARGLDPVPGAWTMLQGARLKIYRIEPAAGEAGLGPGELRVSDRLVCGTGDGPVELTEVQLAGKRRMGGRELARGLRLEAGTRFERAVSP